MKMNDAEKRAFQRWLGICGLVLVTVLFIAMAVAIHSPHYGARSVIVAALIVLGIEYAITAVVQVIRFFLWADSHSSQLKPR